MFEPDSNAHRLEKNEAVQRLLTVIRATAETATPPLNGNAAWRLHQQAARTTPGTKRRHATIRVTSIPAISPWNEHIRADPWSRQPAMTPARTMRFSSRVDPFSLT
jgi:hypothetical protein